jgi:PAS domain S-box-containing protein
LRKEKAVLQARTTKRKKKTDVVEGTQLHEKPTYDQLVARVKTLEAREKRYRSMAENTSDLLYRTDNEGNIIYLSESIFPLSGYKKEEALGLNMAKDIYLVPEEREGLISLLRRDGKVSNFAARLKRKDGSIWWASTNAHFFFEKDGKIGGVEGIARDVTELKLAEEKLHTQAERIKVIFNSLNDAIFVHPLQENGFAPFVEVNNLACERYGYTYEEFLKLTATDITQKSDAYEHSSRGKRRELMAKKRMVFETVHIKKNGEKFPVEINSNIINEEGKPYILAVVRDTTERKRLETQLRKIQQLESVATLSGGIAHEFNNALSVVSGNIELLEMALSEQEDMVRMARQAMDSVERMYRLTNQLHAYARGGKYRATSIDLSDFVKSALPDILPNLSSDVYVDADVPDNISNINADTGQLNMVLMAVLKNASEAIEGAGEIQLRVYEKRVDKAFAAVHPGISPGRYVAIEVEDDGKGMDEETKSRIFDPFFTTKFQGRGLGMAAVYGIVKNHDGYVYVDSEIGNGTAVRIFLPPIE